MMDYKEIKVLFMKLLNFLNQYGEGKLNNQKKIIERIISLISCENVDESVILEVQREYLNLYPARGGLSDFYIWVDDYQQRQLLNEPLDTIRKRLWEIFK